MAGFRRTEEITEKTGATFHRVKTIIPKTPRPLAPASIDEPHSVIGLPPAMDEVLKKAETARRLQISTRALDDWMRAGRVPFYKIGKTVRFRWADVLRHLERNNRVN